MCPKPLQAKQFLPLSISIAQGSRLGGAPILCPCPDPLTTTTFVLSTPSIGAGLVGARCCCISCLLGHTWILDSLLVGTCGYQNVEVFFSCFPLNCSSSFLLSLQFLSRAVALWYHCSIEVGGFSTSINFLLIPPFIPLLNSSTSGLPSYPLPLAAHLNS